LGPHHSLWMKIKDWFASFYIKATAPRTHHTFNDGAWKPLPNGDIMPPWVVVLGSDPADFFWREAGEPWRTLVWEPYYNSLTPDQQKAYLEHWKVPAVWRDYYFDSEFKKGLESTDEPEA
jgi:hypothetical protein